MITPLPPTFTTSTGLQVTFHRLRPEDAPYIIDLFDHLSSQSRYQRFQIPLDHPDPAWVEAAAQNLAQVEAPGEGWLAFVDLPGEPYTCIGGGRFIATGPGVAEASVTVRDDFQGQGLGSEILRLLFEEARTAGIHTFIAYIQASNQAVFRMLKHFGIPYRRTTHRGESTIEMDLTGASQTQPPDEQAAVEAL